MNNNNVEVTDILFDDGKCQLRKTMKGLKKKASRSVRTSKSIKKTPTKMSDLD